MVDDEGSIILLVCGRVKIGRSMSGRVVRSRVVLGVGPVTRREGVLVHPPKVG